MVKRAVTEAHRRSARISALEERARLRRAKSLAATSSIPPAASRRRGRKRKSLQAVVINSVTNSPHQGGENSKHDNSAASDQLEHLSSPQRMPSKQTLEFVLDILQRRDTHEIFAQPVDGQEVVGYYNIIKEPMDFGTMRAKLQEGMYTNLEQFERDVFLISRNAMKFNSSTTVYYTEARAIGELAQRLFRALRTEPENFQLEYTRTRRRPGRKPLGPASDSHARVPKSSSLNDLSLKRTNQLFPGPSHSNSYNGHNNNGSFSGPRDGGNLNSSETDRRMTYMPQNILSEKQKIASAVLNAPKALMQFPCAATQYSDSLMRFAKDLGPTAQRMAGQNLEKYPTEVPNKLSSTPAIFGMAADRFTPNLSALQNPACLNGGNGSQMPNFLSKTSAAYKGKRVCTDEGTNSFRQDRMPNYNDFRGLKINTTDNGIPDHNLRGEEGANSNRKANGFGSSKEKTNSGSDSMDLLIATLNKIGNIQNGHNYAPSGGYYPLTGHDRSRPRPNPPPPNMNRGSFTWLLNHPEPSSLPCGSSSKVAATSSNQNGGGQNTAAPAALKPSYVANPVQPGGWKQPYGEGPSAAAPSALDRYHAAKATQPAGWKLLPNGEGPSSAAPYSVEQNHAAKPVQSLGWQLPNGEGPSSAAPYAPEQNCAAKNMQPLGWKLPNGEGPSSAPGYPLDQNYVGKSMQPMEWKLPNGEGPSSASGFALGQNFAGKNMQTTGWKLPSSAAGYALDMNIVAQNMQPTEWKLPNGEGPSSAVGYALEQNCLAKNMQPTGWKLPNGEGPSSAAPFRMDQSYMAKGSQPAGWKLPNGEGSSSAAPFGMDQSYMPKGNQPTGWMQPNRLGLGPSMLVPSEQKYMPNSTQAAQTAGWKQLNGQGMGNTSAAAPLQQKYMEQQSTQTAQAMEWKQPTSWGLSTMCNLPGLNGPVNGQITPMQQQSQHASAGEVPFNKMNFLGGANSQDCPVQTNAQLLWNRQQSSMNGNGLPDLDLQL